jgi:Leucine-rich repeat (LRR) protein
MYSVYGTKDNIVGFNPILNKVATDTLQINWHPYRLKYPFIYFEDRKGICKIKNDTLSIITQQGYDPGNQLEIYITKGRFWIILYEYSCTYTHKYKIINQHLTLNEKDFTVDDTLVGEIYCEGIHVWDSIKNDIDTTIISGKFKLKIRDKYFNRDSLYREENYKTLLVLLSNSRPDTVKELDFSICGLKSLPKEISKFKNLEILNLHNNELQSLPKDLFKLSNIKELHLGYNLLTSLPIEIFNLKKLEILDISGNNKIKHLPPGLFKSLKNLKTFYAPDSMDIKEYKDL